MSIVFFYRPVSLIRDLRYQNLLAQRYYRGRPALALASVQCPNAFVVHIVANSVVPTPILGPTPSSTPDQELDSTRLQLQARVMLSTPTPTPG